MSGPPGWPGSEPGPRAASAASTASHGSLNVMRSMRTGEKIGCKNKEVTNIKTRVISDTVIARLIYLAHFIHNMLEDFSPTFIHIFTIGSNKYMHVNSIHTYTYIHTHCS